MHDHESDDRFIMVMLALAEATGIECGDFKVKVYAKALQDLAVDQIEKAAWDIINTRTFATFPKVAEIREAIGGKTEDVATLALSDLETAMRRVGAYASIKFTDPLITMTIDRMGGWVKLCQITLDEWKFLRKDFLKIYSALKSRPLDQLQIPEYLPGIVEIDCSARNYEYPPPVVYKCANETQPMIPAPVSIQKRISSGAG